MEEEGTLVTIQEKKKNNVIVSFFLEEGREFFWVLGIVRLTRCWHPLFNVVVVVVFVIVVFVHRRNSSNHSGILVTGRRDLLPTGLLYSQLPHGLRLFATLVEGTIIIQNFVFSHGRLAATGEITEFCY